MTDSVETPAPNRAYVMTTAAAALLVAQQVASKATRDALFLVAFGARRLPLVMGSGAVLSLVIALLMGRALTRFPPRRVVQVGMLVHSALFVTEWALTPWNAPLAAVVIYLHVAALGSVLISAFWSVVSDGIDPHRARTYLARVAGGAALGGVLGGLGARALAGAWSARATLLAVAITSAACAVALSLAPEGPRDTPTAQPRAGRTSLGIFVRSPYLRALALLTVLVAAWEALLEFALKSGAAQAMHDPSALVSFFALFYTGTSLATFVVQQVLGRVVLGRGGVGATLASLPVLVLFGLGALLGGPFVLVAGLQAGESVVANSFYRSAYEVLFTPLPPETKRSTKTIVDVAAARVGDGLGALMVFGVVTFWPVLSMRLPLVIAAGIALVGLFVVRMVSRGYVDRLGAALRAGTVALMVEAHLDATTRRTLVATNTELERDRTVAGGEAADRAALATRVAEVVPPPVLPTEAPSSAETAARFRTLVLGTPEDIRSVLASPLEPELVRAALPLLARAEVAREALQALRAAAEPNLGLLTDALLDERLPLDVRVRIPRVVRVVVGARAVHSLQLGVADGQREIRFHSARALAHLVAKDSAFAPPPEVLLAAVQRELEDPLLATANVGIEGAALDLDDDLSTPLDELLSLGAMRKFASAFTLLSMIVEGESLQLALGGLSSGDERLQGTALELLENILPETVRGSFVSMFARWRRHTAARTRAEILADLASAAEAFRHG